MKKHATKHGGYSGGSHHTPRGSSGTRPTRASPARLAKDMRGLEGLHRDVMQRGSAKRRDRRLAGKSL